MRKPDNLIVILGFLGAMKNYSYIDRLSVALDETSVYEALKDAIRTYLSLCSDKKEVELGEEEKILCQQIDTEKLEAEVNEIILHVKGRSGGEIVKITRELALQAYATIPDIESKFKIKVTKEEKQEGESNE